MRATTREAIVDLVSAPRTASREQAPALIGRAEALVEVRRRLPGAGRLLTLTGVGGVGKSRLAAAAATELARTRRGGCWTLDCSTLTESSLLGQAVAHAIGVQPQSEREPVALLCGVLAEREALLVLDGCDAVLDAAARLVDALLRQCPALHVLVTSRQALGVTGESVYEVPPLACPPADVEPRAVAVGAYDAVALFVRRASQTQPFVLTDDNAGDVAGICRALDGIPLALELAAARATLLAPAEILARLDGRHRLLTKGKPEDPDRLRSLRASVEASFDLCSEEEQALWSRASVFAASFTLSAAEQICAGVGVDRLEVLDIVDSLMDRSILVRVDRGGDEARFRLPESLRLYGHEQLGAELPFWRRRHLDHFVRLSEQIGAEWFGPAQRRLVGRFTHELPELTAALEFAISSDATAELALRVVPALEALWYVSGRVGEARHWLDAGLAFPTSDIRTRLRALSTAAWLASRDGDLERCEALVDEATTLAGTVGEDLGDVEATLLQARGALEAWRGRHAESQQCVAASIGVARACGHARLESAGWMVLGMTRAMSSDSGGAVAAFDECLTLTEAAGELYLRGHALSMKGVQLLHQGDFAAARLTVLEALALHLGMDNHVNTALDLDILAWVAAADGRVVDAVTLAGAVEVVWRDLGMVPTVVPWVDLRRAQTLDHARAALGEAAYEAVFATGRDWTLDEVVAFAVDGTKPQRRSSERPDSPLTARERDVAELVGAGMSNREIAEALSISPRTAQGHVENILRKLGFGTRAQIAAWVAEQKLRPAASR